MKSSIWLVWSILVAPWPKFYIFHWFWEMLLGNQSSHDMVPFLIFYSGMWMVLVNLLLPLFCINWLMYMSVKEKWIKCYILLLLREDGISVCCVFSRAIHGCFVSSLHDLEHCPICESLIRLMSSALLFLLISHPSEREEKVE